jgi:hypothetical protein
MVWPFDLSWTKGKLVPDQCRTRKKERIPLSHQKEKSSQPKQTIGLVRTVDTERTEREGVRGVSGPKAKAFQEMQVPGRGCEVLESRRYRMELPCQLL